MRILSTVAAVLLVGCSLYEQPGDDGADPDAGYDCRAACGTVDDPRQATCAGASADRCVAECEGTEPNLFAYCPPPMDRGDACRRSCAGLVLWGGALCGLNPSQSWCETECAAAAPSGNWCPA
jgi:hypothetical protein